MKIKNTFLLLVLTTFLNACNVTSNTPKSISFVQKTRGDQTIWDNNNNWGGCPTREGYNNNISPHKHAFKLTSEEVRYGSLSERYEVRDGHCGESDCTNPRYRSEIHSKTNIASPDTKAWYGWSFYNKNIPTFRRDVNPFIVVGQWKYGQRTSQDSINPLIKIHHQYDGYVWIQLDDMRKTKKAHRRTCRLWNIANNQGRWIDIVIQTNWGSDKNGFLNIWIDGVQKCEYKGQILANWQSHYPKSAHSWGDHLTHRRGIYVSYTV